jgi:hypothetical protein
MVNEGTPTAEPVLEPPPWLDLDACCPPELRAELAELTAEVRGMYRDLDDLARRCCEAIRKADDASPGAYKLPDDDLFDGRTVKAVDAPYDLVAILSGREGLSVSLYRLGALAAAGADDPDHGMLPEWWTMPSGERPEDLDNERAKRIIRLPVPEPEPPAA